MNAKRRKAIASIMNDLAMIKDRIEDIEGEETDYLESMPENLCYSERAETAEAAVDALTRAVQAAEECNDALEESAE